MTPPNALSEERVSDERLAELIAAQGNPIFQYDIDTTAALRELQQLRALRREPVNTGALSFALPTRIRTRGDGGDDWIVEADDGEFVCETLCRADAETIVTALNSALRHEPGEVVDRAYLDGAKTALNYAERGANAEAGLKAAHEWLRNRQAQFASEKSALASSQADECEHGRNAATCGECHGQFGVGA